MSRSPKGAPIEDRFRHRIKVDPQTHCWEWQGCRNSKGYGQIGVRVGSENGNPVNIGAHRLAWKLFRGEISPGLQVCHHCDNPPCCNPDHLFLGTNKDNAHDSIRKGRFCYLEGGEKHHKAKLTGENVTEIVRLLAEGGGRLEIAKRFGVHRDTVRLIAHGKIWKNIPRSY